MRNKILKAPPRIKNRRKTTRVPISFKIEYALRASSRKFKKIIPLDISGGGLRFVSEDILNKESQLTLILHFPNHKKPFKILTEVVWCQQYPDKLKKEFVYGLKFLKIPSADNEDFIFILSELILRYHLTKR